MRCTSPEVFPGKNISHLSLKLVVEHFCWPYRHRETPEMKGKSATTATATTATTPWSLWDMCGLLKRLRYAVGGGLTGHLLSRLPQLLPCCAPVVNTDSDRHMVKWNLSLPCSGVMWWPFRNTAPTSSDHSSSTRNSLCVRDTLN